MPNKTPKQDYTTRLIPEIIAEVQAADGTYVKYKRGKKVWEEFIPFYRDYDTGTSTRGDTATSQEGA